MQTLCWEGGILKLIDQTQLPSQICFLDCKSCDEVAEAIRSMKIRGAPAIGIAAAFGLVLAANDYQGKDTGELLKHLREAAYTLGATRPTAVNLFWALRRMLGVAQKSGDAVENIKRKLLVEACRIKREDVEINKRLASIGERVVPWQASVLTHCNAGSLATAGYGTALGVLRAAHQIGKIKRIYVDETRPLLQGARLTTWELLQEGIPTTLLTDSMAAFLMQQEKVNLIIVGADRVASNGDVANKIGTYSLAVSAFYHKIPFYVAAPLSTMDPEAPTGKEILVEERDANEVVTLMGERIAPEGINVYNPAFDITPHHLVTGIITEKGIITKPLAKGLASVLRK